MEKYKKVRAVERGLKILSALNAEPGAPVARLAALAGVNRSTAYRILETLEGLGFVRRGLSDESYHLTHKVRALGEGVGVDEEIIAAAAPYVCELTEQLKWPSSVGTVEQDALIIRETTHGRSPLFVHEVHVGTRSPVLTSAMGRAYLAFCEDDKREHLIDHLARLGGGESFYARDKTYVERILGKTRETGFGCSFGDCRRRIGGIAMPIHRGNSVVACMNVVFFINAVRPEQAFEQYVPALRDAVQAVEDKMVVH